LTDLEARQAEMKARISEPEKARAVVLRRLQRHRNLEHTRAQTRKNNLTHSLKPYRRKIALLLRLAILAGKFRELTTIEKIQMKAAAVKKERERREAPMPVEVAASLFDVERLTFQSLFVYPGKYGNLRVVSEVGAPRLFRTADVEDLWEKISETRPDFFSDMRFHRKRKVRRGPGRPRKAVRFQDWSNVK